MSDFLEGLMQYEEESVEKILLSLLDEENIELKSEIERPLNLTKLKMLGTWCRNEGMTKAANAIDTFIEFYLKFQISKKRKSREEVIQAITSLNQERNLAEKLMSKPSGE